MNFYITILEQFFAGILVNMVTAFAKKKISRKRITHFCNHSRSISHLKEESSYSLTNKFLAPCLALDNFYVHANLLHTIERQHEKKEKNELQFLKDQNDSLIEKYLPKVDEKLLGIWNGAIEAYDSTNPDRKRHFMCSIRELLTHMLHILATDNDIKKWTSEQFHFHDGKPTRKARVDYICRNIQGKSIVEYKKSEIKATIEFINILQEGTHSLKSEFSKADLAIIKNKAEATLKFILQCEFEVNR